MAEPTQATPSPVKAPGLEGVIALETALSDIQGEAGELIYRGYDIGDLAEHTTFEEVAYLLWNGELPTQAQLEGLQQQLRAERPLPEAVLEHLRHHTPEGTNPMAALRTAVSMLAGFDEEAEEMSREANLRKAIRLTAKMPTIVAAFDRIRRGKEPVAPTQERSLAYDFLYMLNGEAPGERAERIMDAALVLHAEHGLNASTFAARVIGSTLSDLYSAVTGAIGALKGPLHGGANVQVMKMLLEIDESGQDPAEHVRQKLEARERIMGFGHRVYRTIDPRATLLGNLLEGVSREVGEMKWYEMSHEIMKTMEEEKGIAANVDFFSASIYYLLGIATDLYTPIFAMSRVTGWTAHLLEQWDANRLIRPRAAYVGPRGRKVQPLAER